MIWGANSSKSERMQELDTFIKYAVHSIHPKQRLIIFYHPAESIDKNGKLVMDEKKENVDLFASVCKKNDVIFVDVTQDFENLYERKKILAAGFINTSVGYGHLNKWGHEVIARRLCEIIKQDLNN